ncbi:hypothetical protein SESBI_12820 [Sesbania bispinosa]|nr:hypothetical protein SESBI_12820 [Sesbania bispinosa]
MHREENRQNQNRKKKEKKGRCTPTTITTAVCHRCRASATTHPVVSTVTSLKKTQPKDLI